MVEIPKTCEDSRVIRPGGCMKKTLIAVGILILLYPVVAWLMGFAIEQRVESLTDQGQLIVPQLHLIQKTRHGVLTSDEDSSYELGSTLKITRHYHRGWYSSVDEATVEMSSAALDAFPALRPAVATTLSAGSERTPFRFSLRTVIRHGPLCGLKCFALADAETHASFTGRLQSLAHATLRQRRANYDSQPFRLLWRRLGDDVESSIRASADRSRLRPQLGRPRRHHALRRATGLVRYGRDRTVAAPRRHRSSRSRSMG